MPALVVTVSCPMPPEHMVLPENTETCGKGFTVITTSSGVVVQAPLVIDHLSVYVPERVGVKVAVALDILLNCAVDVFGPDGIVQDLFRGLQHLQPKELHQDILFGRILRQVLVVLHLQLLNCLR